MTRKAAQQRQTSMTKEKTTPPQPNDAAEAGIASSALLASCPKCGSASGFEIESHQKVTSFLDIKTGKIEEVSSVSLYGAVYGGSCVECRINIPLSRLVNDPALR